MEAAQLLSPAASNSGLSAIVTKRLRSGSLHVLKMAIPGCIIVYRISSYNGVDLENDVWNYIEKNRLLSEGQTVGAAVSGGPDSMALLVCLLRLSKEHRFRVSVLHYDHGTRNGGSAGDAAFVQNFCSNLDVTFISESSDVADTARRAGIGFELAGRMAREAFFQSTVEEGLVDVVATAHHLDDNVESIVMHMVRGCGIDGLRGICPKRNGIIRPMLCVGRNKVLEYLAKTGTPYVEDETNKDTSYDRNYVRQVILRGIKERLNPAFSDAAGRLSESASEDADYLRQAALGAFEDCLVGSEGGRVRLDCGKLTSLHPAISGRVIKEALSRSGRTHDVERVHVADVLRAASCSRTGSRIELGQGYEAAIQYGTLVIGEAIEPASAFEKKFVLPGCTFLPDGAVIESEFVLERGHDTVGSMCEYADADLIPEGAVIRTRRKGDTLRPLGSAGRKKLKDYFIDRKVPRQERDRTPLLAHGSNILWVIGSVLSGDIGVSGNTKRICRLRMNAGVQDHQAEEG